MKAVLIMTLAAHMHQMASQVVLQRRSFVVITRMRKPQMSKCTHLLFPNSFTSFLFIHHRVLYRSTTWHTIYYKLTAYSQHINSVAYLELLLNTGNTSPYYKWKSRPFLIVSIGKVTQSTPLSSQKQYRSVIEEIGWASVRSTLQSRRFGKFLH